MDPQTFVDKEYWKDPVCIFTGLTWFVAGITVGMLIVAVFH